MFASRYAQNQETDVEIDMVPIMNMFLVLIPFLLISSSFLHLKAINTSVPVQSAASQVIEEEQKSEVKLTLLVSLETEQIDVEISADELSTANKQALAFKLPRLANGQYNFTEFTARVAQLKNQYPLSDTILLTPGDDIAYQDIVLTMDAGRGTTEQSLFPHVVLSGILK